MLFGRKESAVSEHVCTECEATSKAREVYFARKAARELPSGDNCTFRNVPVTEFTDDELRRILGESIRGSRPGLW